MMIVQKLKGISMNPIAERSAMPVTMPGSANSSTTINEIASRPKNFVRYIPAEINVPNINAATVATAATCSDKPNADQKSGRLVMIVSNHLVVRPGGGKRNVRSSVVKA